MRGFFNPDSPIMSFLGKLTDVIILNIITIICSLPVVTAGAAFTALHYVTLKMAKDEEGYILKSYFKSFKENFRQATVIWVIFLGISAVFYVDIRIIKYGALDLPFVIDGVIYAAYLLCCFTAMYAFPVLARFSNTIKGTLKNAFFMSMLHIFKTILMAVVYMIPVFLIPLNFNFIAVYFLMGMGLPAYINGFLWKTIFVKYEPAEEIQVSEEEMLY